MPEHPHECVHSTMLVNAKNCLPKEKELLLFVGFADFHHVNTSTTDGSTLPK